MARAACAEDCAQGLTACLLVQEGEEESEAEADQGITAQVFHTRLVDSCSSKICAEVFEMRPAPC